MSYDMNAKCPLDTARRTSRILGKLAIFGPSYKQGARYTLLFGVVGEPRGLAG